MTENVKHLPTDCDHWLIISETSQITQALAAPRQHFGNVAKKKGRSAKFVSTKAATFWLKRTPLTAGEEEEEETGSTFWRQ